MRWLKLSLGAALAAVIAALSVGTAEAGWRWKLRYFDAYPEYDTYYPGPIYIPPPRYKRQYERYSSYDDDGYDDDYDPDYYEPQYVPPKKKVKKPQKSQKPAVTKPKTAKKPTTQKQATKTGTISCDKGSKIVAGYGFSAVKPSTCEGKEYAFAATRDGKNYVIKMSSANGELTQVQKQ
jgi:hypothetical protein